MYNSTSVIKAQKLGNVKENDKNGNYAKIYLANEITKTMFCTSKEKTMKFPHPLKSKPVFFATGITEKQFREQILTPQYLISLHNHLTNTVSVPYHHSKQRKYEYKVVAEILLFYSLKFLNNK